MSGRPGPSGRSHTLVLGAALGFDFDTVALFLASLRASGYEGDIALLVHDLSESDRTRISRFRVELIAVAQPWPADHLLRRIPRVALRRMGLLPLGTRLARWLPLPASLRGRLDRWSALLVHPPGTSRYLHYLDFLSRLEHRYERIVLSDVKDVVFQRDPSLAPAPAPLNFYLESSRYSIGAERQNAAWIRQLYGEDALARISACPISCSGTTIGEHRAIFAYLELLVAEMNRVIGRVRDPGFDQGVHNWLVHTGRLPAAALVGNGLGAVLTMGIEDPLALAETEGGDILLPPHPIPSIVHQYNWHPRWEAVVRRRFIGLATGS